MWLGLKIISTITYIHFSPTKLLTKSLNLQYLLYIPGKSQEKARKKVTNDAKLAVDIVSP